MRVTQYQIITFIVTFAIISTTTVQGQFKYITNNDNAITITGYVDSGPAGDVTIPSTISGLPVTTVAGMSSLALRSVTIPRSVSNIEHGAFYRCLGLTNVTLHEGVVTIGDAAFNLCVSFRG